MAKNQPEFQLQSTIADYLRKAHPSIPFLSDVRAALKLTIPQQVRQKKIQHHDFAMPDMCIFAPRHGHAAMFMELKASSPFQKNGKLYKDDHLERQAEWLEKLTRLGYFAAFYWDADQARNAIEEYLK